MKGEALSNKDRGKCLEPNHPLQFQLKALKRLSASDDPDVREMAQTYIGWIEKVQQAARDKKPIDERFETYLKKRATHKREPERPAPIVRSYGISSNSVTGDHGVASVSVTRRTRQK